jgi:hypothetical protein
MARVVHLLRVLLREMGRSTQGLVVSGHLKDAGRNHFAAFSLLLLAVAPPAGAALQGLLLLMVLPALGRDPLHLIPAERLVIWPLNRAEIWSFRLLARLCNPLLWLLTAIGWFLQRRLLWFLPLPLLVPPLAERLILGLHRPRRRRHRGHGLFPLYRYSLSIFLRILDPYAALLLAIWGWVSGHGVPGLPTGMALLLVLAFGTQAQCLFGLNSKGEALRLRLCPIPGWRLLMVKDLAWATLLLPLLLPFDIRAGLGAGLAALAFGHGASLIPAPRLRPWHFLQGPGFWLGVGQTLLMASSGLAVHRLGTWLLLPLAAVWAASGFHFGRKWDIWVPES